MTNFKVYENIDSSKYKRTFLKKILQSIKELALVGGLNGSISGAIAAILAAHGYVALPGFGPIITMGIEIALFTGTVIGALVGLIMGIFIGTICIFMSSLYI
ncbi:hypothetical protein [Bartonella sp. CB178]|uniref:hypothetical protein n=1 Tax=Bartonella sp. CB178 TaxID=3112255 RepID=UPI00300E53EB